MFVIAANDLAIIHENLRKIRRFSWIIVHCRVAVILSAISAGEIINLSIIKKEVYFEP
jgi:hypothetical protein